MLLISVSFLLLSPPGGAQECGPLLTRKQARARRMKENRRSHSHKTRAHHEPERVRSTALSQQQPSTAEQSDLLHLLGRENEGN
jgi:hypothetical protein